MNVSSNTNRRLERGVFERFIATQSGFDNAHWIQADPNGQPDFVWPEARIGVELGEWLHKEQTRKWARFDKFQKEINSTAEQRGLTSFLKSNSGSDTNRYTVVLTVKSLPGRAERQTAIDSLLSFLVEAPSPLDEHELRHGRLFGSSLPEGVQRFFGSVGIGAAGKIGLGIVLNRSGSVDPEDSWRALEKLLEKKVRQKQCLYQTAKQAKGLDKLWLLIHYGRAFGINSPFEGIGIRNGLGSDPLTSLQLIVNRAHDFIQNSAGQPFERVVMFWDLGPGWPYFELWPKPAVVRDVFELA